MKIKEYRESLNLTQKELGEKLGLSSVAILKYEKGLSQPSVDTLKNLSKIFAVSVDTIIDNECDMLDLRKLDDKTKTLLNLILQLNPNDIDKVTGFIYGLSSNKL